MLSIAAGLLVVALVAVRAGVGLRHVLLVVPAHGHLLALAAFATTVAARALRFVILARGVGVRLSYPTSLGAQLAGDAAGAVTPGRAGADPAKVAFASRDSGNVGGTGAVLVGEMLAESLALVAIGAVLLLALPGARLPAVGALTYAAFTLGFAGTLVLAARVPWNRRPPPLWCRLGLGSRRWRPVRMAATRLRAGLSRLRRLPPRSALGAVAVTAVYVGARLAVLPALAFSLGWTGEPDPLVTWPLLLLYAGSLVPVPGGGGAVEVGFALALGGVLGTELLPGLTLWWRFYTFYLGAAAGGLMLLLSGTRRIPRRRPDPDAP